MSAESTGPIASVKYDFTASDTTPNEAVTADATRATRITALALSNLHASTTSLVTIQDNAGSPKVIAGPFQILAGTPLVLPFNPAGWGDTGVGKKIMVVSSAAVRIAGVFQYQRVGSKVS